MGSTQQTHQAPTTAELQTLWALLGDLGRAATQWRFEVAPNPCVGAAVVSRGQEVARGFHQRWGGPHAEAAALAAAAESAVPAEHWDTMVVTLEPCSSRGKTPPCVEAIRSTGIKRLVVGAVDPDVRHRGAGLKKLEEAGVEVIVLEGAAPLEDVCPHFLAWSGPDRLRRPHPWTIAKWAQTRSGHLMPPANSDNNRWISCGASRDEVLELRGGVDAVVTGVGTVLMDDPRFTVRPPGDTEMRPLRVVLDSYLRTPPEYALLRQTPGPGVGPVHILCQGGADVGRWRALEDAGAVVTGLPAGETDHVSLLDAQAWLWEQGARRVLLEAGPTLLSRYLDRDLVDQVRVYTGSAIGGEGVTMAAWMASANFAQRLDRECGADSVLEAFSG
ncbi:MAG: bifunctional diaminohydroxyphosphoribosylaminopyrimidine deaminase/5-amino-6-(5-phosphoribosylamino)uracil reductase RibD [Planctomycetota bacterium]|nr:bifunctional diaminohydroxyphosphoribosylaminopyrimidine deaminase/5-amino-6-(5-phosphoribosylamino)uracil reductase RibD [Planctomycetota bacterium]